MNTKPSATEVQDPASRGRHRPAVPAATGGARRVPPAQRAPDFEPGPRRDDGFGPDPFPTAAAPQRPAAPRPGAARSPRAAGGREGRGRAPARGDDRPPAPHRAAARAAARPVAGERCRGRRDAARPRDRPAGAEEPPRARGARADRGAGAGRLSRGCPRRCRTRGSGFPARRCPPGKEAPPDPLLEVARDPARHRAAPAAARQDALLRLAPSCSCRRRSRAGTSSPSPRRCTPRSRSS
jgi:hypothetical protein